MGNPTINHNQPIHSTDHYQVISQSQQTSVEIIQTSWLAKLVSFLQNLPLKTAA